MAKADGEKLARFPQYQLLTRHVVESNKPTLRDSYWQRLAGSPGPPSKQGMALKYS